MENFLSVTTGKMTFFFKKKKFICQMNLINGDNYALILVKMFYIWIILPMLSKMTTYFKILPMLSKMIYFNTSLLSLGFTFQSSNIYHSICQNRCAYLCVELTLLRISVVTVYST